MSVARRTLVTESDKGYALVVSPIGDKGVLGSRSVSYEHCIDIGAW